MKNNTNDETRRMRLLTPKSLVFGLIGIILASGFAVYHDDVIGGSQMVGNHMPGGIFAYFIFIGLVWNGLCVACKRRSLALDTREMIVVLAMTLVACYPPTDGLFSFFFRTIMTPWQNLSGQAMWKTHRILGSDFLPKYLFPAPWPGDGIGADGYDFVYRGYFIGLAQGMQTVPFWRLPFGAWVQPVLVWGPLILAGAFAAIALQFVVHRQWSEHEQLPYPVAQLTRSFCLTKDGGCGVPLIYQDRLFWWGFIPVALMLVWRLLALWYPEKIPDWGQVIPNLMEWKLPVTSVFPSLKHVVPRVYVWNLDWQPLAFSIVGIAYFIGTDVSLSMGLSSILIVVAGVVFYQITGEQMDSSYTASIRSGASLSFCVMLVYTGRAYYKALFKRALRMRRDAKPDDYAAVTAARVFLLAAAAFYIILSWLCQSWLMAALYTVMLFSLYLTISRILCEVGIPFSRIEWSPADVLVKLFGPAAMGPRPLVFLMWGTGVIAADPRECLMPYVATAAKTADDAGLSLRKLFRLSCVVIVLALAVSFVVSFYTQYNFNPSLKYWIIWQPSAFLDNAANKIAEMKSSGVFEKSLAAGPIGRLRFIDASAVEARFFAAGALAVAAFALMRFRFSRFPLHPVLFVMAGAYSSKVMWWSFLVGWFVKSVVVRFGGGGVYRRLKPIFIGFIAGELFMIGVSIFIDFVYYFAFGARPPVNNDLIPW